MKLTEEKLQEIKQVTRELIDATRIVAELQQKQQELADPFEEELDRLVDLELDAELLQQIDEFNEIYEKLR